MNFRAVFLAPSIAALHNAYADEVSEHQNTQNFRFALQLQNGVPGNRVRNPALGVLDEREQVFV